MTYPTENFSTPFGRRYKSDTIKPQTTTEEISRISITFHSETGRQRTIFIANRSDWFHWREAIDQMPNEPRPLMSQLETLISTWSSMPPSGMRAPY